MAGLPDSSRPEAGGPPTSSKSVGKSVVPLAQPARAEQVFPTLTPEQIARVAAHGRVRPVRGQEMLALAGLQAESFFLVMAGSIEFVRGSAGAEEIVAILKPGQFTGEVNLLSGRQALVSLRVGEPGEVIDVKRDDLLALVQTDSELSDIFMRAFILRRVELIAHGFGDAVLIGSSFCQGALRVSPWIALRALQ